MAEPSRAGAGNWKLAAVAGLVGILLGAGAMLLANGYFIRSYLLENPEILPEAMDRLREREEAAIDRQAARAVPRHRAAIETPFHGAWAGAADGDVVLVEFFDYACGYCRVSNRDIERLLREDPRLKVVWREYPVLGPDSQAAAIASLAAAKAGRFRPFYDRLFATARPTAASIAAARQAAGVPEATPTTEFRQELERNVRIGEAIGATGTPTFVVGDRVLRGAVGYQALRDAIQAARASR
jgi:protein-disulfide isomerase